MYLRCFVQACPSKWSQWISLAEYWYNTTFHSALGRTPFEVLYGNPPRHFGIVPDDASTVTDLQEWLKERSAMTQAIKQNLVRAQQRMKVQADKQARERVQCWWLLSPQMKKALPPETTVSTDEQMQCLTMDITATTPQVLDVTLKKVGNSAIPHALVQWETWPLHWAVWENMFLLQNQHHGWSVATWGQAAS